MGKAKYRRRINQQRSEPESFEQWQTCYRKRVYSCRQQARRAISRFSTKGKRLQPYRCPHCRKYHIGHDSWAGGAA